MLCSIQGGGWFTRSQPMVLRGLYCYWILLLQTAAQPLCLIPSIPAHPMPSLLPFVCLHAPHPSHRPPRHAVSSSWTSYPLRMVPASEVDALVAEDYKHGDGGYTVYLLNPKLSSNQPYAYSYDPE